MSCLLGKRKGCANLHTLEKKRRLEKTENHPPPELSGLVPPCIWRYVFWLKAFAGSRDMMRKKIRRQAVRARGFGKGDDVYNTFSFGVFSFQCLRSFSWAGSLPAVSRALFHDVPCLFWPLRY
jgi:hypothetical protein